MKYKWIILLAAVSLLTGCSLARPEKGATQTDPMVGLYVVRYGPVEGWDFYDNPNLVEYGSTEVETEYGSMDFPDKILIGQYDEENGTCLFPGMEEGWSIFSFTTRRDGAPCNVTVCDMDVNSAHYISSDEEERVELEGTLYVGPPAGAGPDWSTLEDGSIWRYYQVFQMADGTVYLSGNGDSVQGGGGSYSVESSSRHTVNGESTTKSVEVTVNFETATRLEKLVVSQFDGENSLLLREELPVEAELPAVEVGPDTVWLLVEEHSEAGIERSVYNAPTEEPVFHSYVLLDEEGIGESYMLELG